MYRLSKEEKEGISSVLKYAVRRTRLNPAQISAIVINVKLKGGGEIGIHITPNDIIALGP